jgi:catechol 2,3-dioxygenase-like lactoylglutathione lyase family enzyme
MNRPALVPELYVSNLRASLDFYVGLLGFRILYERAEERFAAIALGSAHLMLEETPSPRRATADEFRRGQWRTADLEKPFGRGVNLEIQVPDVAAIESRLAAGARPLLLNLHRKSYRTGSERRLVQQLLVADPDGYLVRLSELVSVESAPE